MSLVIWCKDSQAKVLTALSPVLSGFNGLDIQFVNDLTTTPKVQGAVVILALGNDPKLLMESMKVVPKGRTTTSLRGSYFGHESLGCPIMFSYAPGIADMDYGKYVDLLTDVGTACRFAKTGSKHPVLGEYKYVDDFTEVIARTEAIFAETGKAVESTLDLETVGLDPYLLPKDAHPGAYIVTIQVSVEPGKSYVKRFDSRKAEELGLADMAFLEQLGWFLNTPKISLGGANLKFDLHWIAVRARLECTNFKFDTTLVGSLLDENRSNGLDVHVKIYAPEMGGYSDDFDRQIDKSRMDLVPPDTMLPYAGGDTDGCLRVRKVMKQDLLKTPALAGFYVNILHPAARAFEMVERGGVLVDMDAYKELEADLLVELDTLTTKAKSIMGGRIVAKHHDADKRGGLNLTKASLLVDFMFSPMGLNLKPQMTTEKTGAPSTSLDHLMMFKDVPEAAEFVALLKDFSSATKTLTTYVYGFQKHIRSDGRFHPTYFLMANARDDDGGGSGTVTGRLSARDPAFQCCVAGTKVLTTEGEKPILEIVEDFERGNSTTLVLTHEGIWRAVVGVYRNGVRPVFRVTLKSGHAIDCTENHPLLTRQGWTRTDSLVVNFHQGIIFSKRPHDGTIIPTPTGFSGVRNLQCGGVEVLTSWEESSFEGWESRGLRVQGACDDFTFGGKEERLRPPISIDSLGSPPSPRGGGPASGRESPEQQSDELSLGHSRTELFGYGATRNQYKGGGQSDVEVAKTSSAGDSRVSQDAQVAGGCGEIWHLPDQRQQDTEWGALGFEASNVVSVEYIGDYETFDLTIEDSHSFVANGIVVHNTLPKHTKWAKKLRKCYPAPPGMLVLENDYSQGELRVIACIANEETMIEAYAQGMDLHVITSGRFAGYSYEEMLALKKTNKEMFDRIRQLGKAGNFGLIYGMGTEGFQNYAELNYGVKLAFEEADKFRSGFFETYHRLPEYHKTYKAFARKNGYVTSPLGRVRHLPLINSVKRDVQAGAERQAINSPVQGCLSDMMIWAIAISQQRGWFKEAPCFGAIHDAKYAYIPEDNHEFYVERELELMENLPFEKVGWKPQLKFVADAKIGKNMAELKEFDRK